MGTTPPPYVPGHGLLADRNVLITASAGAGIGFAAAQRCIEEGARVTISDIHERRLAEAVTELKKFVGPKILTPWPDVMIGIGELRKTSLPMIMEKTGGVIVFVGAIIGLMVQGLKSFQKKDTHIFLVMIL